MTAEAVRSETPVYSEDTISTIIATGYRSLEGRKRARAKSEPDLKVHDASPSLPDSYEPTQRTGSTNRGYVRFVKIFLHGLFVISPDSYLVTTIPMSTGLPNGCLCLGNIIWYTFYIGLAKDRLVAIRGLQCIFSLWLSHGKGQRLSIISYGSCTDISRRCGKWAGPNFDDFF